MKYFKSIGLNSNQPRGRGFNHPYDIAFSDEKRIYVLDRMYPQSPEGIRVQICDLDDEWYGEFFGDGPGESNDKFIAPVCVTFDDHDRLLVTDESSHQVRIFDSSGELIDVWGKNESKLGSLDGPSGICVDSQGNILLVEQFKGRVLKVTDDGEILNIFGEVGSNPGQFNLPWGVCADGSNNIYVADWGNDRVQVFDTNGSFKQIIGESGSDDGQLFRPSSVAVSKNGWVVVADWGNERVQIFDDNGRFKEILQGEATLSKWSEEWLDANQDELSARKTANLQIKELPTHLQTPYHVASQTEHMFWGPVSVKFDDNERLYVTEHSRHRIQIFESERIVVG